MAALMDSGPGGLLHLIDCLGGGAAVTGLLSDGAATPLLLGQLLFQFGRHNTADPLLDWLSVLAFALILDLVAVTAFLDFSYSIASQKIAGAPRRGVRPKKLSVQNLADPRHDVVSTGQGDGISQGSITLVTADSLPVRAVLGPAVWQAHEPLALQLCGKPDTAALRVVLIPKGEGGHISR